MKWTKEQEEKLRKLCFEEKSNAELAEIFGCPLTDIHAARSRLNITIPKVKAAKETKLPCSKPVDPQTSEEAKKPLVRRIDDLGRIVIPKAVRQALNVTEGDPLEIHLVGGVVVLVKADNATERVI